MRKAALFYDHPLQQGEVFGQERHQRIEVLNKLYPVVVNGCNFAEYTADIRELG